MKIVAMVLLALVAMAGCVSAAREIQGLAGPADDGNGGRHLTWWYGNNWQWWQGCGWNCNNNGWYNGNNYRQDYNNACSAAASAAAAGNSAAASAAAACGKRKFM